MDPHRTEEPSAPPPCANGCGFFGNPACENLCSKCFRDLKGTSSAPTSTPATPATATTTVSSAATSTPSTPVNAAVAAAAEAAVPMETAPAVTDAPAEKEHEPKAAPKKKNRCGVCRKKLGMLGFECRCSKQFCAMHRHADQHECDFDYRTHDLAALAKVVGPAVRAEKIGKL